MAGASVNTGSGNMLMFTTSGTSTSNAVANFSNSLNAHVTTFVNFDTGATTGSAALSQTPLPGTVAYTLGIAGDIRTAVSGQYTIDSVPGPSTVKGSSGGSDSVLSVGATGGTGLHYIAEGGSNYIIFNDGNNLYTADTVAGAGNLDSIYAGSGFDTIITGTGDATVASGVGDAVIVLNDTLTGPHQRDVANLHDGRSTVDASGAVDVVFASAVGQVINGGAGSDYVVLQPDSQSGVNNPNSGIVSSSGLNTINDGSGTMVVFAQSQGNTINAGSGTLFFVGESSKPDSTGAATNVTEANTINAAQGGVIAYLSSGDDLTANISGSTAAYFIAGNGNETLNAAGSTGAVVFYGSSDNAPVNASVTGAADSVIGGSGTNYFITGQGDETLVGGSGTNLFFIEPQAASGGTITIQDFNPNVQDWAVLEGGTSVVASHTIMISGQASLSYTLSDGTTVNFQDVTSLGNHFS